MKLSDNKAQLLFIGSISAVGVWMVHFSIIQKLSFWNVSGLLIGGTALSLSIEDRRNKKNVESFNNLAKQIEQVEARITAEMERNDFAHDQQLIKLATDIASVGMRLDLHTEQMGHKPMIEQMLDLRQNIGDLSANMGFITEKGAIQHELKQVKGELRQVKGDAARLEGIIDELRSEIAGGCCDFPR